MESGFRVIIVGGGIAGLALANALQLAGIDFLLLEQRPLIDPQVGASIGLLPNAGRILDQLGVYDDIRRLTVPIKTQSNHRADGTIIGQVTDTLVLLARRTGYDIAFFDRQLLLRVLANHVNPSKILLNSKIVRIEQDDRSATAHLADGRTISGDVLVGADGIYSRVRSEMWRQAEAIGLSNRYAQDKSAMFAEYKCAFGISNHVPGMVIGETHKTFTKDLSTMTYVGKGSRVFWFIFVRMNQVYRGRDIPRFTQDDATALLKSCGDLCIKQHGQVRIRDLHRTSESCILVPLEEAGFENWTLGRIVCIGDAVHKVTPNLGAGGSCAIETVACLANTLHAIVQERNSPDAKAISLRLEEFHRDRRARVNRVMKVANYLTRLQALRTRREYIKTHILGPIMEDSLGETFSDFLIGAPAIEYLPFPERSLNGTMPFNPEQGWGYAEFRKTRAKIAAPLLMVAVLCLTLTLYLQSFAAIATSTFWTQLWQSLDPGTSELDGPQIFRARQAVVDFGALYIIWLSESCRGCHKLTLLQIPSVFVALAQLAGFGIIAPIYFVVLYAESQVSKFKALDNRLTDTSYSKTILPAVALFFIVPAIIRTLGINKSTSVVINALLPSSAWMQQAWMYSAVLVCIVQFAIAGTFIRSTVRHDRLWHFRRDLPVLRFTAAAACVASSVFWIYTRWVMGHGIFAIEWNSIDVHHTSACISALGFLFLAARDFSKAGMFECSWSVLAAEAFVLSYSIGPTATFVLGWMWREEILVTRHHKGAVTRNEPKMKHAVANPTVACQESDMKQVWEHNI